MQIKDYEIAIEGCDTPEGLWALVGRYFADTVVERVVYLHLPPMGAPDERSPGGPLRRLPGGARLRATSPSGFTVTTRCSATGQQSAEPVYWDAIIGDPTLSDREHTFVEEFRPPGLGPA